MIFSKKFFFHFSRIVWNAKKNDDFFLPSEKWKILKIFSGKFSFPMFFRPPSLAGHMFLRCPYLRVSPLRAFGASPFFYCITRPTHRVRGVRLKAWPSYKVFFTFHWAKKNHRFFRVSDDSRKMKKKNFLKKS